MCVFLQLTAVMPDSESTAVPPGDMTCEGKPGKALEEDGSCPEAECFNDAHLGQVVLASGSVTTGAHWTVGIKQCLQKVCCSFFSKIIYCRACPGLLAPGFLRVKVLTHGAVIMHIKIPCTT